MITQVTYERLYNIGNYESLRLSAVASVESGNVEAAWAEAKLAVEAQHTDEVADRTGYNPVAEYAPPPASDKQRAFIRSLAADLDYTDETLDAYAKTHGIEITALTKDDASALISRLKLETREERIIDWSKRVSGAPAERPGTVGEAEIPF